MSLIHDEKASEIRDEYVDETSSDLETQDLNYKSIVRKW